VVGVGGGGGGLEQLAEVGIGNVCPPLLLLQPVGDRHQVGGLAVLVQLLHRGEHLLVGVGPEVFGPDPGGHGGDDGVIAEHAPQGGLLRLAVIHDLDFLRFGGHDGGIP
jgi:hypothetical protein